MRGIQKRLEIIQRAVVRMDGIVVGDVVAVVAQRGREKWHEPKSVDAQVLQIIELLHQTGKVADAVVVAVAERADVQLVNDRVFVPKRLGRLSRHDSFSLRRLGDVLAARARTSFEAHLQHLNVRRNLRRDPIRRSFAARATGSARR